MYVGWVAGTAVGVVGGDVIGDPEALGLDAAFPAFFLALLVPQIRSRRALAAALGGAAIAHRPDPAGPGRGADPGRRPGRAGGAAPGGGMSAAWWCVLGVGAATIALKTVPAVVAGGRTVPPRLRGVIELLAPALLAALVVTQTFASDRELVLDPRAAGLGAAAVAIALRAPVLLVALVAAVGAALVRLA